jgi:hypothetical protein
MAPVTGVVEMGRLDMGGTIRIFRKGFPGRVALFFALLSVPVFAKPLPAPGPQIPDGALHELMGEYAQLKPTLGNTRYIALVNYRQPSWERRFYIIDPETAHIVASYVVAHGMGSDPKHSGYAQKFGDRDSSHMSSLGFFVTGDTYESDDSDHGLSMRLKGLSDSNRNAEDRAIVIHAAGYLEPEFIKAHGKPGRSFGCLAFSAGDRDEVVEKLKGGALIYSVYDVPEPAQLQAVADNSSHSPTRRQP